MDEWNLAEPAFNIDVEKLRQIGRRNVQTLYIQILRTRQASDRSIDGVRCPVTPFKEPLQNAAIFTVTGPQEFALLVLAEPVHEENLRHPCSLRRSYPQPLGDVTSDVLS